MTEEQYDELCDALLDWLEDYNKDGEPIFDYDNVTLAGKVEDGKITINFKPRG